MHHAPRATRTETARRLLHPDAPYLDSIYEIFDMRTKLESSIAATSWLNIFRKPVGRGGDRVHVTPDVARRTVPYNTSRLAFMLREILIQSTDNQVLPDPSI